MTRRWSPSLSAPLTRSDRGQLLVELELDDRVSLGREGETLQWSLPESRRRSSHGRDATSSGTSQQRPTARPQSATVRRSTASAADKLLSPYKLKQKVLSSRSRLGDDGDLGASGPSSSRDRPARRPLQLIADAIRENMATRAQLLVAIEDELAADEDGALLSRNPGAIPWLSNKAVRLLNRLRAVTLAIVEMVRYFGEQPPMDSPVEREFHWAVAHESHAYLLRVCASDTDGLFRFPRLARCFEALGVGLLRNPLLDGVALDSSELLLCACQHQATAVTSSSLFQLVVRRLEAFAVQIRQALPAWQVLPFERVAAALVDLLEVETRANASRMLPTYLRATTSSSAAAAFAPRPIVSQHAWTAGANVTAARDNDDAPMETLATASKLRAWATDEAIDVDDDECGVTSRVASVTPIPPMSVDPAPASAAASSTRGQATMTTTTTSMTSTATMTSARPTPRSSSPRDLERPAWAAAEPKLQVPIPSAEASTAAKKSKKPTLGRAVTTASLAPTTPTNALHPAQVAIPTLSTAAPKVPSRPRASENAPVSPLALVDALLPEQDEATTTAQAAAATIARALDKLPQLSLQGLTSDTPLEAPMTTTKTTTTPMPLPSSARSERLETTHSGPTQPPQAQELEPTPLTTPQSQCNAAAELAQDAEADGDGDAAQSEADEDEDEDDEAPSALSRILALCRDVEVAAVDLKQRLHVGGTHLPPPPSDDDGVLGTGRHLSTRYLERELKMLRRYFARWGRYLAAKRAALEGVRVTAARRRIGRFCSSVHRRRLAERALTEAAHRNDAAGLLQRQWHRFHARAAQRRRQGDFHVAHRAFRRFRFFVRVTQRRRRRELAMGTLRRWWADLRAAQEARAAAERERRRVQRDRELASRQLQGFVREHMIRRRLQRALEANRHLLAEQAREAARAREDERRRREDERERLEELRRQSHEALREMERRWHEAESSRLRLAMEQELTREAQLQDASRRRREAARQRIGGFVVVHALRRRLESTATERAAALARVGRLQESQRAQDARERLERGRQLLQRSMLEWKLRRVQREQAQAEGARRLLARESAQRAEMAAHAMRMRAIRELAREQAVGAVGAAERVVLVARIQGALELQRRAMAHVTRALAENRIGQFVWSQVHARRLERARLEAAELRRRHEDDERRREAERAEAQAQAAAQRRAEAEMAIHRWWLTQRERQREHTRQRALREELERAAREELLRREQELAALRAQQAQEELQAHRRSQLIQHQQRQAQLKAQALADKHARENRQSAVAQVMTAALVDVRHARELDEVGEELERARLAGLEAERRRQQLVVAAVLETTFRVERLVAGALAQATDAHRAALGGLVLEAQVARLRRRAIERRVARRWLRWTLARRTLAGVVHHALWPAQAPIDARISEDDARRSRRLHELKCSISARRVQRWWRLWRLRHRQHKRLAVKREEDRLVHGAKRGTGPRAPEDEPDDERSLDSTRLEPASVSILVPESTPVQTPQPEPISMPMPESMQTAEPTQGPTLSEIAAAEQLQRWFRGHRRALRLRWRLDEPLTRSVVRLRFARGRAWLHRRSSEQRRQRQRQSPPEPEALAAAAAPPPEAARATMGTIRVRLDGAVTRYLLTAARLDEEEAPERNGMDASGAVLAALRAIASDLVPVFTRARSANGDNEDDDDNGSGGDHALHVEVDELDLPRFCALTRQMSKTRSMRRRQQLLEAKASHERGLSGPALAEAAISSSPSASSAVWTIFDCLADGCSVEDAQFLLQQGEDLHRREPRTGRSALHVLALSAARVEPRLAMLEFLLDRARLDPNAPDHHGATPLLLFAARGDVAAVTRLVAPYGAHRRGADWRWRDAQGQNALHVACAADQVEVAGWLLGHVLAEARREHLGHDGTSIGEDDEAVALAVLLREELLVPDRTPEGPTPLHVLVRRGHGECLRELLAIAAREGLARWVLHELVDARGQSLLHAAIGASDLGLARMLLEAGAPVDRGDCRLRRPLHLSVEARDARALSALLVEHGGDLGAIDERGDGPLHWAAATGRAPVVTHLLVLGADPTARNGDGETPADVAAGLGHGDCVRLLLPVGYDPHYQLQPTQQPTTTIMTTTSTNIGGAGPSSPLASRGGAPSPLRDLSHEAPSSRSYCVPSPTLHAHTTTATTTTTTSMTTRVLGAAAIDWDEIHRDVELVDESGRFSSEDDESDGENGEGVDLDDHDDDDHDDGSGGGGCLSH